jgi:UDP-glucose 4-epimerase
MQAWIIGSGGMLGSACSREAARHGAHLFAATPVPWGSPEASATLTADAARFREDVHDDDWAVVWAAGSSIVASRLDETTSELTVLQALLDALESDPPRGRGAFFLTSSAGGVFAGSANPPFDLDTPPAPLSPYGQLKLDQELAARTTLGGVIPLGIGRFANLYGADFNAAKGQGLIQQLCRAALLRQSLNLYVSMDTVRDYIYVDDAAAAAWGLVQRIVRQQPAEPVTAVIATGQPATVAQVIATVENVAHRRVSLALGTHPSARHQVIDLRLAPTTELLGDTVATPLPAGIKRVVDALAGRVA